MTSGIGHPPKMVWYRGWKTNPGAIERLFGPGDNFRLGIGLRLGNRPISGRAARRLRALWVAGIGLPPKTEGISHRTGRVRGGKEILPWKQSTDTAEIAQAVFLAWGAVAFHHNVVADE